MQRYFLPPDAREGQMARIEGADFHHLARVMRMQPGAAVEIVAAGEPWRASVESVDLMAGVARIRLLERLDQSRESLHPVTLVQGLAKGDKVDSIVRQACEIGVTRIILFRAVRSVADLPADRVQGRLDRWRKIAKESCETAHRDVLPEILFASSCQAAMASAGWAGPCGFPGKWLLVPYESQMLPLPGLRTALQRLQDAAVEVASPDVRWRGLATGFALGSDTMDPNASESPAPAPVAAGSAKTGSAHRQAAEVAVVIGPEGGFADEEIELLRTYGATLVTLGPRILRTETAGVVAVACVLYELGELENRLSLQTSQEGGVNEHVDA
ncbi:MAG: RsmE family RNA methyltransferase [Firmicutes bacterium]|nr:RsmE family RNA methyltransferase [Bacillota bacterium]